MGIDRATPRSVGVVWARRCRG